MKFLLLLSLFTNLFSKEILGEIDRFNLPEFNLKYINSRIDTGAKTSSIHSTNIKILKNNFVEFQLFGKYKFQKKIHKIANVKSSNGIEEKRVFIKSIIEIFDKTYEIELSLNNRANMQFPLLVGRELLEKGFVVDVSQQNLSFSKKN